MAGSAHKLVIGQTISSSSAPRLPGNEKFRFQRPQPALEKGATVIYKAMADETRFRPRRQEEQKSARLRSRCTSPRHGEYRPLRNHISVGGNSGASRRKCMSSASEGRRIHKYSMKKPYSYIRLRNDRRSGIATSATSSSGTWKLLPRWLVVVRRRPFKKKGNFWQGRTSSPAALSMSA